MIELCGNCGHENDHRGKRCQHDITLMVPDEKGGDAQPRSMQCQCPEGIRTDLLLCRLAAQQIQVSRRIETALMDLIRVTTFVNDVSIDEKGQMAKGQKSLIEIPT